MFRQNFSGRYFIGKDLFRTKFIGINSLDKKFLDKHYHKDKNFLDIKN